MKVRPATGDDADLIADVHFLANREAYGALIGEPPDDGDRSRWAEHQVAGYRDLWRDQLGQDCPDRATLVASANDEVVGFCEVRHEPDGDVGEILGLYVTPSRQRQGLGRALVADALSWFTARDVRRVVIWALEPAVEARAFYEALGWTPDGATRTEPSSVTLVGIRYQRYMA